MITIPLKRRIMMTYLKMSRIKMSINLKSQTLHPLRRINTAVTISAGCPTSGRSTVAQTHPFTSVDQNSPCALF